MRIDWVPFSAAALVAGAVALVGGTVLQPSTGGGSAESLQLVQDDRYVWLAAAGMFFFSAVALTAGLPSVLTLLGQRASRLALTAVGVFGVGCIGIAGYAMLLAFFRALVLEDAIRAGSLDELTRDAGLGGFLFGWIGAFYIGELLLGVALLRNGSVPKWVPTLMLLHVATLPLGPVLPDIASNVTILLLAVPLTALGISANSRAASDRTSAAGGLPRTAG